MAVRVDPFNPALGPGTPRVVATLDGSQPLDAFDVAPDGRRFLVLRKAPASPWQLRVTLNWMRGRTQGDR